jgi:hypothetical protein
VTRVVIARWAGWAPGVEGDADWRAWAAAPRPLLGDGQPDAKFLPLHVRRRCDLLSRMMLRAAHTCVPDAHERARLRTVFASRYGSFNATVRMMEGLARNEPLSPSLFMQSVHNAQSGLFSIWSKNTAASTAIAGRGDTFACGFVEALCQLHEGGGPILLLTGDEALPPPVAHLSPERFGPYATALLLARDGDGVAIDFEIGAADGDAVVSQQPQALAFLAFLLGDAPALDLHRPPRSWTWCKAGAGPVSVA